MARFYKKFDGYYSNATVTETRENVESTHICTLLCRTNYDKCVDFNAIVLANQQYRCEFIIPPINESLQLMSNAQFYQLHEVLPDDAGNVERPMQAYHCKKIIIENSMIIYDKIYTEIYDNYLLPIGSNAYVQCIDGYGIDVNGTAIVGMKSAKCNNNGQWSMIETVQCIRTNANGTDLLFI